MGAANRSMLLVTLPWVRSFFIWIRSPVCEMEGLRSAVPIYREPQTLFFIKRVCSQYSIKTRGL